MNRVILLVTGFLGFRKLTGQDRKSAGEWGFLLSMLFIVPLLFWEHPGVIVSVVLQLLWAAVGTRSAFLASETWKKNRQKR
ncbi:MULTISPECIES: hypothetical protein [Pantoea]|uniref:hypothetical protein n=1 Tax=Pantoea TaxID=53335 RepID=UPI0007C69F98|nr:hypothetical protein [Pantoea sp. OXWO6B1]OAD98063.1 hypothetical protein A6A26_24295 [Pantoea sp. OXWO6B1]